MAVTIGNISDNTSQGTTSYSHNNNGDFLLVCAQGTTAPTGVTYNGVALTQIGTNQAHAVFGRTLNMWGLVNPAAGSNTLAVSGSANVNFGAVSFSGVGPVTPYSGFTKGAMTSAVPSIAVTTTIDDAYVFAWSLIQTFSSVGANTTSVRAVNGDGNNRILRSTNTVATAGSFTINLNSSGGQTAFVAVGINPVIPIDYPIVVDQGSFTLSGQTALITSVRGIIATVGSFIINGRDLILTARRRFAKETKPTTTFTMETKSTTDFSKSSRPTTIYTKETKPF